MKNFKTSPWSLTVEGEVGKKAVYDMTDIMKLAPLEERVYRHGRVPVGMGGTTMFICENPISPMNPGMGSR